MHPNLQQVQEEIKELEAKLGELRAVEKWFLQHTVMQQVQEEIKELEAKLGELRAVEKWFLRHTVNKWDNMTQIDVAMTILRRRC
jgi:HAMP domain-containing protein